MAAQILTLDRLLGEFLQELIVLTNSRLGDAPSASRSVPTSFALLSVMLCTSSFSSRSYQALSMMPLTGAAEECGMTDGVDRRVLNVAGIVKDRAIVDEARESVSVIRAEARQAIIAKLIDDDRQDQLRFKGRRAARNGKNKKE
jgi:hypothetical protein